MSSIGRNSPSIGALKAMNDAAWDHYRTLIQTLPVWRNAAQQRQIHDARQRAENTKWALETAQFWNQYSARRA